MPGNRENSLTASSNNLEGYVTMKSTNTNWGTNLRIRNLRNYLQMRKPFNHFFLTIINPSRMGINTFSIRLSF